RIELASAWGGGLVASVDGLRFVVPVATINAGPNPRYFGVRRGVTWLNAVNDRYSGLGAAVVPGTVRDSLYLLDTLLSVDADHRPEVGDGHRRLLGHDLRSLPAPGLPVLAPAGRPLGYALLEDRPQGRLRPAQRRGAVPHQSQPDP